MAANELSIEKIFLILQRRMRLIIGIFSATVLIAAIITYQTPKMYRATTSLNFEFSAANPAVDDGGRSMYQASYLTTQIGIMKSLNVAQQVVDSLNDYEKDRLSAALRGRNSKLDMLIYGLKRSIKSLFSGTDSNRHYVNETDSNATLRVDSPYSSLARAIGADLLVDPMPNSRIVKVSYFSTNPRIAALLANRFAEAYISTNLKMVIDPAHKSKVWFDEQLKSLRARLEEAQANLTLYQQKEGIVSSDERIDIEMARLRTLSDQLVDAQRETRNAETQKQKLKEVMARGGSLKTFEPVFKNSVVQKIKAEIRGLEGQLVEVSNSLGKNHPKIRKLKSELSAAHNRLNREIQVIEDGINNAADLSKEREHNLQQAMEAQKTLVLELKYQHDRIAVFEREVESTQASYNAALNQMNTTSMQSVVDQTNVAIVDRANIPGIHATPSVMKNIALGVVAGLLLGIGIAIVLETFVRKVHSREDLISELGIPLLGHLKKV